MSEHIANFASSEYQAKIIVSMKTWVRKYVVDDGWKGYFLNFMFSPLKGNKASLMSQMRNEVERFYCKIITRIVRNPRSAKFSREIANIYRLPGFARLET